MPKGSEAALWILAFYTGEGGETCLLPTSSHWCILRDLGSSGGVPVVFALHGFAGKPSTAFLQHASRLQALLPPDSCVLHELRQKRWHSKNNQRFVNSAVGWLRKCSLFNRSAVGTKGRG